MAFPCFRLLEPGLQCSRSFSLRGKGEKSKKGGSVVGGEVVVMEYLMGGGAAVELGVKKSVGDRKDRGDGARERDGGKREKDGGRGGERRGDRWRGGRDAAFLVMATRSRQRDGGKSIGEVEREEGHAGKR